MAGTHQYFLPQELWGKVSQACLEHSVCIGKFLRNISTAAERRELRLCLLARLGTYHKAVECAKRMRIIEFWPADYPGPELRDKANELTDSAGWVTAYTLTRERWDTCWRFPTILLACSIVNSGIPHAQLNTLEELRRLLY